jgi:hypothetical protein
MISDETSLNHDALDIVHYNFDIERVSIDCRLKKKSINLRIQNIYILGTLSYFG